MGDWYVDRNGRWQYDPNAPSPGAEPTRLQHSVRPAEQFNPPPMAMPQYIPRQQVTEPTLPPGAVDAFEREDGLYHRIAPEEFPIYDHVDSRTVPVLGAPEGAQW